MRGAGGQGRKVLEMVVVRGPTIPSDWPGWDYENLGQKKKVATPSFQALDESRVQLDALRQWFSDIFYLTWRSGKTFRIKTWSVRAFFST